MRYIRSIRGGGRPPTEVFHDVSALEWYWLHAYGRGVSPTLRHYLPRLPPRREQIIFTGTWGPMTLWEAFRFYTLVREQTPGLSPESRVVDFGCGWGRIIRFFIKDVEPASLCGVDPQSSAIATCTAQNQWASFQQIGIRPPTSIEDGSLDLIYAYSVFSHLSEDVHLQWLEEFARVLRPGGTLILTTRDRDFILQCARQRASGSKSLAATGARSAFHETDRWLRAYDDGAFCYDAVGGGTELPGEVYGESCIPEPYVRRVWTKWFDIVEYINDRDRCPQNVIVCTRGPQL
jgi:SAM-dependent methyltransferase